MSNTDGIAVSWADVRVTIGANEALKGVSGTAQPGRLTALMGPSGSGKTTLLTAVAHRIAITSGDVLFGGLRWSKALRRRVAFVEQDDIVFPELTVRESLSFLARLRLEGDERTTDERVSETIKLLRLEACEHTKVGSALMRGVSGGERKRLCIAQELLVEPAVMLLDEPTSGLDSAMAMITVEVLAELARARQICVICSIHQPSSQVFHSFDDLILLNKGKAAYAGPVNAARAHFANRLDLACPADWNPADFFMDCCVGDKLSSETARAQIDADAAKALAAVAHALADAGGGAPNRLVESVTERYAKPWRYQLRVLLQREWAMRKGALWDWNQLYLHAGIAALGGVMWFGTGYAERDIFPRFTASFAVILQWARARLRPRDARRAYACCSLPAAARRAGSAPVSTCRTWRNVRSSSLSSTGSSSSPPRRCSCARSCALARTASRRGSSQRRRRRCCRTLCGRSCTSQSFIGWRRSTRWAARRSSSPSRSST